MSTLRAILELHGSLDTAVIRTADPRIAEVADRFLPGTSANTEWFREIEAFMFPRGNDSEVPPEFWPRTEADPVHALQEINSDRTADDAPTTPTIPQLSRMVYGIGALIRLERLAKIEEIPLPFPSVEEADGGELLVDVLALAGQGDGFSNNREILGAQITEVLNVFANDFTSWRDWTKVADQLVGMGVLSEKVASVPLCKPAVVTVDGIESMVVDTEFSADDVSLNDLLKVVDPRNWNNNFPSFFCAMQARSRRPDTWHRVLEFVGFCYIPAEFSPRLRTMLKYYKSRWKTPTGFDEARLDYDLSDPPPDGEGDGQITVDRGFINMRATQPDPDDGGVFVRTRKVAHINGFRPYTMAKYVCLFGYADATLEMLFGSARNPDAKYPYSPWDEPEDNRAGSQGQANPPPAQSDNSAVSTTIKFLAACAKDLTAKNVALNDKWMAGQLTVKDLADYSAEVGARIASDPWKLIQAISKPGSGP
jgi:hypothetical protein